MNEDAAATRLLPVTMKDLRTPCIGICSTTSLGDRVCRGCKRYAAEVIDWNSCDEELLRLS